MKEGYRIHQEVSEFVNSLPEDRFRADRLDSVEAVFVPDENKFPFGSSYNGMLFETFNLMFSRRHGNTLWSIAKIHEEAVKNRLYDSKQFVEYAASVENMVDLLEEEGVIEYLDQTDANLPTDIHLKKPFRINNSNASLAAAYEYLADLAGLYGIDEENIEDFKKIAGIYYERAEKAEGL